MIFEELREETVEMIPIHGHDRLAVTVYLRLDADGSTTSIFIGDGDHPQLTPEQARQLADALHRAADHAAGARLV